MAVVGTVAKTAFRLSFWVRVLILAEVALTLKRYLDKLTAREKEDLQRLVVKSKGKPSNLTARERQRVVNIVEKLEPAELAKDAAKAGFGAKRGPLR